MRLLILGGTAFLGRELAVTARGRGHQVTCLARGVAGAPEPGVAFVQADRTSPSAYDDVRERSWDAVVELTWDPGLAAAALDALAGRAAHWTYVSSVSAYARHDAPGAGEDAALLPPDFEPGPGIERYGQAKAACEQLDARAVGDRLLVVRPGLIGGPGDASGRSGYWVARAARNRESAMLVPDTPTAATQVVDVRDLSRWLVSCAEAQVTGTYDAVGPQVPFADWVALCRAVGGHRGPVRPVDPDVLAGLDVAPFMGPRSLAMWVDERGDLAGWSRRSGDRAVQAGLVHRPREDVVADLLRWESEQGLDRPRDAGLTPHEEAEILRRLGP